MSWQEDVQKLDMPAWVDLFELEYATASTIYMTPYTDGAGKVSFGGQEYNPVPIDISGIETTSTGPTPQPTISISNINSQYTGLLLENDDFLGAYLTRKKTFAKHLDNGSNPDSSVIIRKDLFRIEKKESHDGQFVTFTLNTPLAFDDQMIPRRSVLRSCGHTYRIHKDGAFEQGTCGFTGSRYFDKNGNTTTPENDSCGKRLSDCKKRFQNEPLDFRGFPGVRRL